MAACLNEETFNYDFYALMLKVVIKTISKLKPWEYLSLRDYPTLHKKLWSKSTNQGMKLTWNTEARINIIPKGL